MWPGERARLGAWTLHTQGALGGGGQFNNWSESQKRGELVSGVSSTGWGRSCGVQVQTQGLARAVRPGPSQQPCLGPIPGGQGDTVWPSFVCGYSSTRHWAYWKSLRPELRQRGKAAWSLCPCFFMWGMVIILALPPSQGCCEEPTAQGGGCLWPPQGTGNQSPSLLL